MADGSSRSGWNSLSADEAGSGENWAIASHIWERAEVLVPSFIDLPQLNRRCSVATVAVLLRRVGKHPLLKSLQRLPVLDDVAGGVQHRVDHVHRILERDPGRLCTLSI